MTAHRRISRIIEHWTLPEASQVLDHVRRAQIQVVQVGNFGLDFYSLAEDRATARPWAGMPLFGIAPNLELAAEVIPQIQAAGAAVVGQLSTTMHFGDHEQQVGLFGPTWQSMWTDDLLGPMPCADIADASQRQADGSLFWRTIPGRPYRTYRGCMCNPNWRELLKAMVRKGVALGLDGFNATHHYESLCRCTYCEAYARSYLRERLTVDECVGLFGTDDLDAVDPFAVSETSAQRAKGRLEQLLAQGAAQRRKASFDEVFIEFGRQLKPSLLLAQWNHKYDFRPHDERSLLPSPQWGAGEDYLWYSQGPHKWGSDLAQGYLADMGLPSRFIYAAGEGKPFVINKYDYRRWRIWLAEALAHHGTAVAFHAGPPRLEQEERDRVAPEDYYGPVIRYQRFMAEHESFLHPARPYSQLALVYPRRAELEAEMDCLNALKKLGTLFEDDHWLFDIILDEQIRERAGQYDALILPEVERLSDEEIAFLDSYAEEGGVVVFTGKAGRLNERGKARKRSPLQAGAVERGRVVYLEHNQWAPERIALGGTINAEMPVYPQLEKDEWGQRFLGDLSLHLGGNWLSADAPWFVRVRAWLPQGEQALVIHWINYRQDEDAAIEVPLPVDPFQVQCALPAGRCAERVEWRYPEMRQPIDLEHAVVGGQIRFTVPRLIAYGMSIVHFA